MYRVPGSSTPPATPNSKRASLNNPSTTPAGPPPSNVGDTSFTPVGPPPSSIFGSSQLNFGTTFSQQPQLPRLGQRPVPFGKTFGFQALGSSPPQAQVQARSQAQSKSLPSTFNRNDGGDRNDGESHERSMSDLMDEDVRVESQESSSADDDMDDDDLDKARSNGLVDNIYSLNDGKSSLLNDSMNKSALWQRQLQKSIPKANTKLARVMKSIANSIAAAPQHEPDGVILQTENTLRLMHRASRNEYSAANADAVYDAAETLVGIWRGYALEEFNSPRKDHGSPLWRANYIASLVLELHYPPRRKRDRAHNLSSVRMSQRRGTQKPIPRVLLDWKHAYQESEIDKVFEIQSQKPNSTAHPEFWDVIFDCLLNGKLEAVLRILKGADFTYASTAEEDGLEGPGYGAQYVENIRAVIDNAIEVIGSAPAVQSGDWDVTNSDWALFRNRISQAISDLRDFAEGDTNRSQAGRGPYNFTAESFGISGLSNNGMNLSTASRRATSPIPWSIYQALKQIYSLLQGDADTIISVSMDWTDAVIGLTVWWDGEDEGIPKNSLAYSSRTAARSQRARPADVTPVLAYQNRLAASLVRVTQDDDSQMAINTMENDEVGLAALFAGDTGSVVSIICGFSMTIGTALAEIADAGAWLTKEPDKIAGALDRSELMLLNHSQGNQDSLIRDNVLIQYANLLSKREVLRDSRSDMNEDGWETAIRIMARLHDEKMATQNIRQLLDQFQLNSSQRVDKIVNICNSLGFTEEARKIAEKFADWLAESTTNFGSALLYYARAHEADKVKELLDFLSSLSLIHSVAYPSQSELDDTLKSFTSSPGSSLNRLDRSDHEAAQILSKYMSGYATIRKFYDLRDQQHFPNSGAVGSYAVAKQTRRQGWKQEAASALIALIKSASDSIRGGLLDPDVDAVIQVDGLLALLGEALPFLNHNPRIFTSQQLYDILAAIEDLQAVSSRVFSQCDQFLASAFATAQASDKNPDDGDETDRPTSSAPAVAAAVALKNSRFTLKRFVSGSSGLTGSAETEAGAGAGSSISLTTTTMRSQFSMIGSSMLDPTRSKIGGGGSGRNDRPVNGNAGSALTSTSGLRSVESSAELLLGKKEKSTKKGGDGVSRKTTKKKNDNADTEAPRDDDDDNYNRNHVRRSWDWRRGWQVDATGEDVLRVLRLNVAKELARGWMDGCG